MKASKKNFDGTWDRTTAVTLNLKTTILTTQQSRVIVIIHYLLYINLHSTPAEKKEKKIAEKRTERIPIVLESAFDSNTNLILKMPSKTRNMMNQALNSDMF